MNYTRATISGGKSAQADQFDGVLRNAARKPDAPNMSSVGCKQILRAVNGTTVELIFAWNGRVAADQVARRHFVGWWVRQLPGASHIEDLQGLPNGTAGTVLLEPDVNGRPCGPPPAAGGTA